MSEVQLLIINKQNISDPHSKTIQWAEKAITQEAKVTNKVMSHLQ